MELLAIHVGGPKMAQWRGQIFETSIFKEPVTGPVAVGKTNIEGDRQSDLSVHGGPDKAVYVYPAAHYPYWRAQYPDLDIDFGMLGENLTISEMREDTVRIGDTFRIGTAEFTVTQPRLPCYKLSIRFNKADVGQRMMASMQTGFYVRVEQVGEITVGDPVEWVSRDERNVRIYDLVRIAAGFGPDKDMMRRALEIDALPEGWRDRFEAELAG